MNKLFNEKNDINNYPFLPDPIPVTAQNWNESTPPLVTVSCITYMHAPFIRDAIEGFLMQKTTFRIEVLIRDDASTDGTAEIIKEYELKYPYLFKCFYQAENTSKHANKKELRKPFGLAHRAKYISKCEGDDYWTDSHKLQKQVEFMESHQECSLCFHRAEIKYENGNTASTYSPEFKGIKFFPEDRLFYEGGSSAPTASLFYRREIAEERPKWRKMSPVGDMPLKMLLFIKGRVGFINEVMSVRRLNVTGSWNDRVRNQEKEENIYLEKMIRMLNEFNKYTEEKYVHDVRRIVMSYDMKRLRLGKTQSIVLSSSEFSGLLRRMGIVQKMLIIIAKMLLGLFYKSPMINRMWVKVFSMFY